MVVVALPALGSSHTVLKYDGDPWCTSQTFSHIMSLGLAPLKNFRPTFFTELECTFSPFLSSYESTENVKVCTAATAYTNEHGRTYIMIFGQGLWQFFRTLIS